MQLIDLCDHSTLEDRANMSEFYLHNMVLTDMNLWDPNAELGYLQLMALASWMKISQRQPSCLKIKRRTKKS